MKRFARMRLRAVTLVSSAVALTSATLGAGLIQAPQANADSWGCGGLINNNFAYCISSESQYGQKIEDPWIPTAANQKYMDQSVIVRRCLTSSDAHCTSDRSSSGDVMKWQIDKITWVNPQVSDYVDTKQMSTSSSGYGCTGGTKGVNTTFVPGHGTTFESFGFLPDVGTDREFHSNWLSKAFSLSAGILGDLTFGASTPGSWQLGETQSVTVQPGYKGWLNLSPGFVQLKGEAILHMQYRWNGGDRTWHHKDLRIRDTTLVVPHTISFNGAKIQSATVAFRSALINRSEWTKLCSGQSPSPWHHLQVKVYSTTKSIKIIDHSTGYSHCFSLTSSKRPAWLDANAADYRSSVFQGENVEVGWYSNSLCDYPHQQPNRPDYKHTAPLIDGLTNWWIK
ncbi:hypothetical protein OOK27_27470 [Streptomyces canus]|uniref:hypothetical protein n=1 Tax=Streptomyces canus TaxID=58343 RepID=UPI00225A8870|nr:hypothetical protein [Streptomyces canus]MCX5257814.1 hypothetical protein [Streptomyces canus]